ncbi:hypothetical protein PFICI_15241 [Pestalotiopsis fici W106-1]|uniref:Uncharacterized protein n=1 Tax=Pestalotiopsis fici (strain W106-1 / CGMCC3.15140) TaxID=1229662 RepID=W3WJT4_PESFW|nr:uncharacterized protein PFICI_15241 [Pestalotiopsis fici W106-1]ETS73066.1 hypothetical protein PFICI_15241 [Pestalotiopsis fici W106-1]
MRKHLLLFAILHVANVANGSVQQLTDIDRRNLEPESVEIVDLLPLVQHPDDVAKRFDIPGVDLDSVADEVWGKVKSEVADAVDAAKKTFDDAVSTAKETLDKAVAMAKEAIEKIKDEVEKIWEEVKKKVAELEDKVFSAIHDWIHDHIVEPLIKLLVIILVILLFLPTWWLIHIIAKLFDSTRKTRPAPQQNVEMQSWDEGIINGGIVQPSRPKKNWAYYVVRSWEKYGLGAVCLLCPFVGGFISWLEARKVPKLDRKMRGLRGDVQDLQLEIQALKAWRAGQEKSKREEGNKLRSGTDRQNW